MPDHDIIVMGASAGGVESLSEVARELPADLDAAVLVVMHMPAVGTSVLPAILSRVGPLRAAHAVDGQPIERNRIAIAPPGAHMLVKRGHIKLVAGPRENGMRPAIDPLFRSAAAAYGPRVMGVVLSGALDDGSQGLGRIRERGGTAVVLDPDDALFDGMARAAIASVPVDHVVGLAKMGSVLARLAAEPRPRSGEEPVVDDDQELDIVEVEAPIAQTDLAGEPSGFTCPECSGVLWEVRDGQLVRYRCRVGHAYSPAGLLSAQSDSLEAAIWAGIRSLEESGSLQGRLAGRARELGQAITATRFERQARASRERATILRAALTGQVLVPAGAGLPADPATGKRSEEAEAREQQDTGS
ncbi:MAG: chemotaxis protein CheB [Actinomycetota bacterium]